MNTPGAGFSFGSVLLYIEPSGKGGSVLIWVWVTKKIPDQKRKDVSF